MARKKIIAGNWKMNMTPSQAVALVAELKDLVVNHSSAESAFYKNTASSVSDKTVLFLLEMGTTLKIDSTTINDHYKNNTQVWNDPNYKSTIMDSQGKYIEHQNNQNKMYYGQYNSLIENSPLGTDNKGGCPTCAYNACEVDALYNSLVYLDGQTQNHDLPELIKHFEENGNVMNGYGGTSPYEINNYLKSEGYNTTFIKGDDLKSSSYTGLESKYDTYIVTVYNDKNYLSQVVHTMSITKESDGLYYLHNSGSTSDVAGTLEDVISGYNGGSSETISIIGVGK